jgi:hypothetical protein
MMFPFLDEEENEEEVEELEEDEEQILPREYGIDFETGQLTGQIVEGAEAVKVWAWLALQTPKFRYYVYPNEYGQEFEEVLNQSYTKAYVESELKRITEETLAMNPYIAGIEQFSCELDGDHAKISLTIMTDFGQQEEVEIVV